MKLLKQELEYTKETLQNLQDKQKEHKNKPCQQNEVPKCKVGNSPNMNVYMYVCM